MNQQSNDSSWKLALLNKKALLRTNRQRPLEPLLSEQRALSSPESGLPQQPSPGSHSFLQFRCVAHMPDKLPPLLLFFFSGTTTSAKQDEPLGCTFCNAWVKNWKWTCTTVKKHRPSTCEDKRARDFQVVGWYCMTAINSQLSIWVEVTINWNLKSHGSYKVTMLLFTKDLPLFSHLDLGGLVPRTQNIITKLPASRFEWTSHFPPSLPSLPLNHSPHLDSCSHQPCLWAPVESQQATIPVLFHTVFRRQKKKPDD